MQMWMNVLMELVNVIKTVTTILGPTPAPVMLATHSTVMDYNVKVFHVICTCYVTVVPLGSLCTGWMLRIT